MVEEIKAKVVGEYGEKFYNTIDGINKQLVKQDVKTFDIMMLVSIVLSVVNLLKDCNFKLPGRLNFFQKRRLTRAISNVMIERNDERLEYEVYEAILKQHKQTTQEDVDQLISELKNSGKLVDN